MAQTSLPAYIDYLDTGYKLARHHQLLCDKLEAVERGEITRLMVFMPPGSAKSTYGSTLFPSWYLGRNPQKTVIAASHTAELAERFGRRVRNIVGGTEFNRVFGFGLADDSQAAGRWDTSKGGEYFGVGVGGSVTGRRADLGIIDDPVKSREDADSQTQRDKVWEWYKADFFTRLKPASSVVLIQCMTGDTRVLMEDGSEKELKSIKVGDYVATYKDAKLSVSKVLNWANNGPDLVLAIKTSSGTIVKANGRHPFLVNDKGVLKWIRAKNLLPGQEMLRVNGEFGKAKHALLKGVKSKYPQEDIAHHTTTKNDGRMELGLRLSILNHIARRISSIATESLRMITTRCFPSKTVDVQFAGNCQVKMSVPIGAENSALTIATKQEKSEGFFATIATLLSGTQKKQKLQNPLPNTSDFTTDKIVEIVEHGVEDVFDVQIEETENFIANGLVSHNTRWHEDDLAGRLLKDAEEGGEQWEVLSIPMIAEENDALGREPGELLWPEWFTEDMIAQAKRDPRNWLALYQQQPRPDGGGEFRREWINFYDGTPEEAKSGTNRYILVDAANGKRSTNDYTSMWVIGLGQDENYYVLDMIRDRLNLTGRASALMTLHRKWKPISVRYERYGMMADIQHIKDLQRRENYRFEIVEVGGQTPKVDRIKRLVPLFEPGKFWFPQSLHKTDCDGRVRELVGDFIEQEFLAFPVGLHDDMLDALARIAEPEKPLIWPKQPIERDKYKEAYTRRTGVTSWAM